jgi:hypothetical protein
LSLGSSVGTSHQPSGGQPESHSGKGEYNFWTFVPPPVPVRRMLLLFVLWFFGWRLMGGGGDYLVNKRRFLGPALFGFGFFLWIGILVVWFIGRYAWAWGLPI